MGGVIILLSPTLIGLTLGGLYYLYSPDYFGKIIGLALVVLGLLAGILWAVTVKKKHGTIWFISRVMATPELDSTKKRNTTGQ